MSRPRDARLGRSRQREREDRQPVPLSLGLAIGVGLLLTALGGGRCAPEPPALDVDPVLDAPTAEELAVPEGADCPHQVVRVVDGDTIVVHNTDGEHRTVRLLGIDTPESVHPTLPVQCFALEAAAATSALVGGGEVWLEADPSQDDVDQYGRTLAYVWLADGRLVNEEIVASGYGREFTFDTPGKYQERLAAAEAQARADRLGLWSDPDCDERE